VYTQQQEFKEVVAWCSSNDLDYEIHLARTRFWVPRGRLLTQFLLRWGTVCTNVDGEKDHSLGR